MAVPASRRPEVMLKELVAVVDVLEANLETLSVLVNDEEELELCDGGPWLGLLLTGRSPRTSRLRTVAKCMR